MNKVLYKIFGAMSKDSYGEICKHFGIDKVEESIRHRQEKFVKTYSGYSNSLCHLIFARLCCVKLLILYYRLFILCVFLLNLRYFLCYHMMLNKVVYTFITIHCFSERRNVLLGNNGNINTVCESNVNIWFYISLGICTLSVVTNRF